MSNAPIHIIAPVIDNVVHINAPVALGTRGQRGENGAIIQQNILNELASRIDAVEASDNSNLCNLPPLP